MKKFFTLSVIFLLVNITTFSQELCKKGTWELGGTISFSSSTPVYHGTTGNAITIFQFSPQAGYFITDNFELGLVPFQIITQSAGGASVTQFNFLIAPAFNFSPERNVHPYIQGLLGYGSLSSGSSYSGLDYGIQAGLKVEVVKSGLINIGASYVMTNRTPDGVTERVGTNDFKLLAGFSVFIN